MSPARSWLFTKKSRSALAKVQSCRPDIVVLDLEDSVKAEEKQAVRKEYVESLRDNVLGGIRVFIRTSDLDNKDSLEEDIDTFVGQQHVIGFILPKVELPEDVCTMEDIIVRAEKRKHLKHSTAVVPLVESSKAYFNLYEIATSSKRNVAMIVGGGDFTTSSMCEDHSHTYRAFFSKLVLAARAANIEPIWSVHDKIDNHAEFERICLEMKRSGFGGAAVLTPKQALLSNATFTYTPSQLKWMGDVLRVDELEKDTAISWVQASIQESRQMIGPPHIKRARTMRERHTTMESSLSRTKTTESNSGLVATVIPKGLSRDTSIGRLITTPQQVTVTEGWKAAWESSFIPSQGVDTSLIRANELGLTDLPVPLSLAVTMTAALAVSSLSYHARVHLAFTNIFQNRPLLVGDTVRALFSVDKMELKEKSGKPRYCLAHSTHWLVNQRNEVVIQLQKKTMFDPLQSEMSSSVHPRDVTPLNTENSFLRRWLLQKSTDVFHPQVSQCHLLPGQLITHDLVKVMGHSEIRSLCILLYIVNPHHHNIARYSHSDILIPGPFVMSAGMSNSSLDIGEVIYEEIPICIHPNKTNFGDQIGTLTYVLSCCPLGDLEEVTIKQLVVKNTDMGLFLTTEIPKRLFEEDYEKPSEYEKICADECPILLHKIVCVMVRKIVRARPGNFQQQKTVPKELQ